MMFRAKRLFGGVLGLFFCFWLFSISDAKTLSQKSAKIQETDAQQQINGFSLSGYGAQGKKTWQINGTTADVSEETVELKDIVGNLFQDKENVTLTARKGLFNKTDGKLRLEEAVTITTSSGAKLTTASLEWDRNNQLVSTQDKVNIERENLFTTAVGVVAHPDLNALKLEKEAKVRLLAEGESEMIKDETVVTCDGPLEVDYRANVAKFHNNVQVTRKDLVIYCDTMEMYFNSKQDDNVQEMGSQEKEKMKKEAFSGSSIDRLVCRGNVRIVKGENISYCQEAVYTALDGKIVLTGRPKLVIYSTESLHKTE